MCLQRSGEQQGRDCLFPQTQRGSALLGTTEAMPASFKKKRIMSLRGVTVLEGGLVAHPICVMGEMDGVTPRLDSMLSF